MGRLDEPWIDSLQGRVNRQHHEWQKSVGETQQYRGVIVKERQRTSDGTDGTQAQIDEPFISQNENPTIGTDQRIDPKRQRDREQ